MGSFDLATEDQIRTFWAMLADRRWDDRRQLLHNRRPRPNYLAFLELAYKSLQAQQEVTRGHLSAVIDDLYCFKGWEVERRLAAMRAKIS
jgi:hypothetical protein